METIEDHDARPLPYDERVAREVVAPYIDSVLVALPEPGHESTPDFEVCRDGKRVGWLEVTTATDQASRTLYGQLERIGHKLSTDRLQYDWFLLVKPAFDVRAIGDGERLFDALAIRELTGTPYPTRSMGPNSHPESDAILNELHVAHGGPTNPADGDAVVRLNPKGQMHMVDANTINRLAVERFTAKRSQLEGRQGERHLFVWVDIWERSGASVAMGTYDDPQVPDEGPVFPDWVSDVWLLHTVGQPRLWHCSRATGVWRTYAVDPAIFDVGETT